jgi:hypothetical protein
MMRIGMKSQILASIVCTCCTVAFAADAVVAPATSATADINLPLPAGWVKPTDTQALLADAQGKEIHPQPSIKLAAEKDSLKAHLEGMTFWGEARLTVQTVKPDRMFQFYLVRGPLIGDGASIAVTDSDLAEVWLYNPSAEPLVLNWRILSGSDKLCGATSGSDCDKPENWQRLTIGPARSDPVEFRAPAGWFHTFDAGERPRVALMELRFGPKADDPVRRVPLNLKLAFSSPWGRIPAVVSLSRLCWQLLWTVLWVFAGAAMLMLAQVMIPNFLQGLKIDEQIEGLERRLRAVSSNVGNKVHASCKRELENAREILPRAGTKQYLWERVLLSVNTSETKRLADAIPRIETRLQLTESLGEALGAGTQSSSDDDPISLRWGRQQSIETIQAVLAKRTIGDADRKTAQDNLDQLTNPDTAQKALGDGMVGRIAELKSLFPEPLTSRQGALIDQLPGCTELLHVDPDGIKAWTPLDLRMRDLAAIRLRGVAEILELPSLVPPGSSEEIALIQLLQTNDPFRLARVRIELTELSQGVAPDQIKEALVNGEYDVWSEPSEIRQGDTVRVWLRFNKDEIESSAAKDHFRCYWGLSPKMPAPDGSDACTQPEADWEEGWSTQFIPDPDASQQLWVWPCIQERAGNYLTLPKRRDGTTVKGACDFTTLPNTGFGIRLFRGVIDALLTALVPVVTIAITQIGNATDPGITKLVTIGFTSQAIRSAIVRDR